MSKKNRPVGRTERAAAAVRELQQHERRRRNLRNEVVAICTHRLRRDLEGRLAEDP